MWQIHSAVPLRPPVLSGTISFAGVDLGCPLLLKQLFGDFLYSIFLLSVSCQRPSDDRYSSLCITLSSPRSRGPRLPEHLV